MFEGASFLGACHSYDIDRSFRIISYGPTLFYHWMPFSKHCVFGPAPAGEDQDFRNKANKIKDLQHNFDGSS